MAKPLTAFQLLNKIKKLVPKRQRDGAVILSYLKKQGYIEEVSRGSFDIKPGLKLSKDDASRIANEFSSRDIVSTP